MISHISGILEQIEFDRIVVDVNGVGYEILVTGSVARSLPKKGDKVKILTFFSVREDAQILYGFASKEEKSLFRHLISVSGIGPKGALSILSAFEIDRLVVAITKGIGKKTGQKVIIELKEKIAKAYSLEIDDKVFSSSGNPEEPVIKDAVSALMTLGYTPKEARSAIAGSGVDLSGKATIEEIIKQSLRRLS